MTLPELPERALGDNPHAIPFTKLDSRSQLSKPQLLQVLRDGRVKPLRLGLLLPPLHGETAHLVLEGFAIVRLRLRAHVAAGGQDMAVPADFLQRGALAEAGNVGIVASAIAALPGMVGIGDAGDVLVGFGPACNPASLRR